MIRQGLAGRLVFLIFLAQAVLCPAQEKSSDLVLKVEQTTLGPMGGQKGASCLKLYSGGRFVYFRWSISGMSLQDKDGKIWHPDMRETREYLFPERDSWQISQFMEFLQSKSVGRLKPYFAPPHEPIDYFETSTVHVFLPAGKSKQLQTREYYVASLVEKAKYPSALILLMDKIEQLEDTVTEKGTPTKEPPDCKLGP